MQIILSGRGPDSGGITTRLPHVSLPQVRPDLIVPPLPAAVTVAMLAAIESLLSAVVADGMSGDRHNSPVDVERRGEEHSDLDCDSQIGSERPSSPLS